MKTILFVIFSSFILFFAGIGANAQNYKAQLPVQIDSSGVMKNEAGTIFATISKDSIIKDHKGEKVAFIDRNGNLIDKNGKILGKTAKNGDFHNAKNEVEYTVQPSTKGDTYDVYDNTGKRVLIVPANYKAQAGIMAYVHKNMLISR
ncbi:5-fold beta-flower protein [Cytophaga aurantiaca]|uniref:5-fold beta-flower protein n=1 Tax=Cytophaga aurantiaca TaxID=29530 RepID=UPI0003642E78|nr:hypothetical protein [Cytophaga aurantiaca]